MSEIQSLKLLLLLTWIHGIFTAEPQILIKVRVGDDVTLPCKDVKDFRDNCKSTTWIYVKSGTSVPLFEHGEVHKDAGDKSDRLRVTEECLLVLEKVTVEDKGFYICRQFRSGKTVTDSPVELSFLPEKDKTLTNKPTVKTSTTTSTSIVNPAKKHRITDTTVLIIVAAVVVASLIITAVVVVRWRRNKERKQQMGPKTGSNVNPAAAQSGPESSRRPMDPEDEVSYITINHCNVNRGAQVQDRYPQHDTVIYSTVQDRAAARAAPDLNNGIYSVVQKTNR